MTDLPDLDRVTEIHLGTGSITLVWTETYYDQCSDPDCQQPHRLLSRNMRTTVDASPDTYATIGEFFIAMGLGFPFNVPVPISTEPDSADQLAQEVHAMSVTNIAGASKHEQSVIQAVAPAVVRSIHRLADTIDTAATHDRLR